MHQASFIRVFAFPLLVLLFLSVFFLWNRVLLHRLGWPPSQNPFNLSKSWCSCLSLEMQAYTTTSSLFITLYKWTCTKCVENCSEQCHSKMETKVHFKEQISSSESTESSSQNKLQHAQFVLSEGKHKGFLVFQYFSLTYFLPSRECDDGSMTGRV